jgi:hypothetical protein
MELGAGPAPPPPVWQLPNTQFGAKVLPPQPPLPPLPKNLLAPEPLLSAKPPGTPFVPKYAEELVRARKELAGLQTALGSGQYRSFAVSMAQINKDLAVAKRRAEWEDLVATQGRFGAGLTRIDRGLETFQGGLGRVQGLLGNVAGLGGRAFALGTGTLVSTVSIADPARFERFTNSFRDLGAVVGLQLAPVLDQVTSGVYRVADALLNLDPAVKAQLVHWGTWGTVAGGVIMVLPRIVAPIGLVVSGVRGLTAALGGLSVATGGMLPALGLVVSALAGVYAAGRNADLLVSGIGGTITRIVERFEPVTEALGRVVVALEPAFRSLGDSVLRVVDVLVPSLTGLINVLADLAIHLRQFGGNAGVQDLARERRRDRIRNAVPEPLVIRLPGEGEGWGRTLWGSLRQSGQQSSFGMAPGIASLGGLESGWKRAMTAMQPAAAEQTAENTRDTAAQVQSSTEVLREILRWLNQIRPRQLDQDTLNNAPAGAFRPPANLDELAANAAGQVVSRFLAELARRFQQQQAGAPAAADW